MHADQVAIDAALVRRLLARQMPDLAMLPLRRVQGAGTQNALFRLGDAMAVRLPLIAGAVGGLEKEIRWLPMLARRLSLEVPEVLRTGGPDEGYPFPFTVQTWLEGRDAAASPPEQDEAADRLAALLAELADLDPSDGPTGERGGPLVERDEPVRAALDQCRGLIDTARAAALWDTALAVPPFRGRPVWLHGDLIPANMLVRDGRLAGLLDFGSLTRGDPAYDLIPAWFLLDPPARARLRAALRPGPDTWARARGLVLSQSLLALPYYLKSNPGMVALARRGITQVLAEG